MGKIRINKLALELNVQNDRIIDELKKNGTPVKNYMSSIDEDAASYIRALFQPKPETPQKKATAAKAKTKAASKKAVVKAKVKKAVPKAKTAPSAAAAKTKADPKTTARTKKEAPSKPAAPTAPPGSAKKPKVAAKAQPAAKTTTRAKAKPGDSKPKVPVRAEAEAETGRPKPARKLGLKIVHKKEQEEKAAQEKAAREKQEREKKDREKAKAKASVPAKTSKPVPSPEPAEAPAAKEEGFELVKLQDNMTLRDLAECLKCSPNEIIKDLMSMGIMATINQNLDSQLSSKIADNRGFEVEILTPEAELDFEESEEDLEKDRIPRPPIVTIMGHVDHGKTSLLDAIRKSRITDSEHGGITQHIGAYQVKVNDQHITFLDTPGHEAFTAMRARGAQVTDMVILVVAADDGIKPQTKEAIDHSRAANVPIIVAINKIDKPDAKPEEVKKQLADYGLLPEDWGGQTIFTEVSALKDIGLDHLLEMVLLQAEILEIKANPKLKGRAVVIESHLDKGRGPVATVIVDKGLLRVGDPIMVGNYFGKVRALVNDQGKNIPRAGLSKPIEVVGLPEVPSPGDRLMVVSDERRARQLSAMKIRKVREKALSHKPRITMEDLHQQIMEGEIQELNLIIKADVQGSIQAVKEAFSKLRNDQVRMNSLHGSVGGITESDVLLASASNAIIIGFNVRPTEKAALLAEKEKVDVRLYSVIYDAINDVKQAMQGMLAPTFRELPLGRVEVREVFNIPKIGAVAGCHVLSGKVERNAKARLVRDSVVVHEGKIQSLRRFKEDVKEVASGYECGLMLEKFQDVKPGDIVEPYVLEEVAATLVTSAE